MESIKGYYFKIHIFDSKYSTFSIWNFLLNLIEVPYTLNREDSIWPVTKVTNCYGNDHTVTSIS